MNFSLRFETRSFSEIRNINLKEPSEKLYLVLSNFDFYLGHFIA